MSDRQGIWLDRGELDKIIAISVADEPSSRGGYGRNSHRDHYDDHDRDCRHRHKSWFGELFD